MAFKKGDKVQLTKDIPPYEKEEVAEVTKTYEAVDFSTMYYELDNNITVEERDIVNNGDTK